MKNNTFTYDFVNKTIVGTKADLKRAGIFGSAAYQELSAMMSAQPTFTVVSKSPKENTNKKTYKRLSFEKMEEYIKNQPNSEENLLHFEAAKKTASSKNAKYPLVKKWFLATFPEYKENRVTDDELAGAVETMNNAPEAQNISQFSQAS